MGRLVAGLLGDWSAGWAGRQSTLCSLWFVVLVVVLHFGTSKWEILFRRLSMKCFAFAYDRLKILSQIARGGSFATASLIRFSGHANLRTISLPCHNALTPSP